MICPYRYWYRASDQIKNEMIHITRINAKAKVENLRKEPNRSLNTEIV